MDSYRTVHPAPVAALAIGAISVAVIVLTKRSLTDIFTIGIEVATAAALWHFKKLPEPIFILVAAAIGLLLKNV